MEHLFNQLLLKRGPKIIGIGLNYTGIAKTPPSSPILFSKALSAVISEGTSISLPVGQEVVHEIELAVLIGKALKNVASTQAAEAIGGYCLALDMTSTTSLKYVKEHGLSWALSKNHDTFLPLSRFLAKQAVRDHQDLGLELTINGQLRQKGNTKDMIFPISEILSFLSSIMTLQPGDLILTGTPAGATPVEPGDHLVSSLSENNRTLMTSSFYIQ